MLRKLKIFWRNFRDLFKEKEKEREVFIRPARDDVYEQWTEESIKLLKARTVLDLHPEEMECLKLIKGGQHRMDHWVAERVENNLAIHTLYLGDFLKKTDDGLYFLDEKGINALEGVN